jgi:integrase
MATILKTAHGWQAQVARRVNGKSVRKAKTFKTKREAQVWSREFEVGISNGTDSADTMRQVFDRYARERSKGKKGERWEVIRLNRLSTDMINGKPLGEYPISDVTTADLVAWRDMRLGQVQPASVSREMNLLKHVFSTATKEWGLLKINPMEDVKRPPKAKRRKRRVHPDEIEKLTKAFGLDEHPWESEKQITGAMFLFAIETAMRSGEIRAIQNRHVSGHVVHIPETKNDHTRDVPLTNRALEILETVRGDRTDPAQHPFNIDAESRDSVFRAAVKKVGIEDLHFHDTRHEAITRLSKQLEILDLARVSGHKNLNELLTYYEASGDELAARLNSSTSREETK